MPHEYAKQKKPWEKKPSEDVEEALGDIRQLAPATAKLLEAMGL